MPTPDRLARLSILSLVCLFVLLGGVAAMHPTFNDLKVLSFVFCAVSIFLMALLAPRVKALSSKTVWWLTALLLINGTLIRLVLAWFYRGNYDMVSWQLTAERALHGLDPYSGNSRYNYSPLWFWILGGLRYLNEFIPPVSFHFIVCSFLTKIDLATFFILAYLHRSKGIPALMPALFFYFNPISYLLTGYQGQFESLAILAVVLGLTFFGANAKRRGAWLFWGFCTLGTALKQIVFFQTLVALNAGFKSAKTRFLLFGVTAAVFFALLAVYWNVGKEDIVSHVLLYSSYRLPYGISTLFEWRGLKWLFVGGLVVFPFFIRKYPVERQLLLMMLFFLVFTTGVGVQYFILPVALGALRPSKGFYLYTLVTTLFLLGSYYNLHIQALSFIPWNAVWMAGVIWFGLELSCAYDRVPAES